MPGMAEPDIAIDIISNSPVMSPLAGSATHSVRRPRIAVRTLELITLDGLVTAVSALVCYSLFNPIRDFKVPSVLLPLALLTLSVILNFAERGLYAASEVVRPQLNGRKVLLAWVQAVAISTLVMFCASAFVRANLSPTLEGMTRTLRGPWLPFFLTGGFTLLIAARAARVKMLHAPTALNRTVVAGDQQSIHDLILRLRAARPGTFDLVGVVEHTPDEIPVMLGDSFLGLPLYRDIDSLERLIRQDAVDTVLVALSWSASEQAQKLIQRVSMAPVDVYVYPGLHALKLPTRRAAKMLELPLMMVCNRPINGWKAAIKRMEDVVLAAAILAFISPVMLGVSLAIKLTSKGPVFFRQRRLGYNNRVIEVLKFRSMYTHLSDADAQVQALRGDKRVTPLGAWLRRTSLDELPQLINVLRGDMSLVGPRPHALATTAGGLALEEAVPVYSARHRVKPGITGWAQIHGHRGALDSVEKIVHRVNHDLYYIENWSLGLDLKILFQTIRLVFADDNAF